MPPYPEPILEPTTMDMICQFNKLKPPKFQGGANPLRYEEWKWKLGNLFDIMECPNRYKVALTTYQFEGVGPFCGGWLFCRAWAFCGKGVEGVMGLEG